MSSPESFDSSIRDLLIIMIVRLPPHRGVSFVYYMVKITLYLYPYHILYCMLWALSWDSES